MTDKSFNIVVFSKNRACQLDLFLTSMKNMFKDCDRFTVSVLYQTSGRRYARSYCLAKKYHGDIHFRKEENFKHDLVSLVNKDNYFTVFFVDDIVWKHPFSTDNDALARLGKDNDILCLSLRLDPTLSYCYAYDMDITPPAFDEHLKWDWTGGEGDFGYPMSLDGHIFRTSDILPLISNLSYHSPNTLEERLSYNPVENKNEMICLPVAPIFNIPANKVQTYNDNRHGGLSAEILDARFRSGYRIAPTPFEGFKNTACHQEVDYTLEKPGTIILKSMACYIHSIF